MAGSLAKTAPAGFLERTWVKEQVTEILQAFGMEGYHKIAGRATIMVDYDEKVVYGVGAVRSDGWLNCIAVRKGHQRKGIGSKIVRWLIAKSPVDSLWLETMFWNRRFYESLGFRHVPIGKVREQFGCDPRGRKNTMVMTLDRHSQPRYSVWLQTPSSP